MDLKIPISKKKKNLKTQRRSTFLLGLTKLPQRGNPTPTQVGLVFKVTIGCVGLTFSQSKRPH